MMKRYEYILLIIYNFVKMSIMSCITRGRLKCARIQLISPKTHIVISRTGRILLRGRIHTEANVLLSASNGELDIGDNVYINRNTMIVCRKSISIGDGTTIGPNVCIYDHDHDLKNDGELLLSPVKIGKNVWIGAGAIILRGTSIGDNSVVAAGTILKKDVPSKSLVRNDIHSIISPIEVNE